MRSARRGPGAARPTPRSASLLTAPLPRSHEPSAKTPEPDVGAVERSEQRAGCRVVSADDDAIEGADLVEFVDTVVCHPHTVAVEDDPFQIVIRTGRRYQRDRREDYAVGGPDYRY